MKKRMFVLLLVLVLLLTGCGASSITLDLSGVKTDPERFVWGSVSVVNGTLLDVSLGDVGLFYPKENLLYYYDLESRQEYVLCGRANCMHNSTKCEAYFASDALGNGVGNVAQIDEYLYCTYCGSGTSELALIRIDLRDGTRKTVASFSTANSVSASDDQNTFFAESFRQVDYCNGWAWFELQMGQRYRTDGSALYFKQITGVNLETGEVVALNGCDDWTWSLDHICPERIYFSRRRDAVDQVTEAEYFEQFGDGPAEIDGMHFESYFEYWCWHCNETPDQYELYVYTIGTGETKQLWSGETIYVYSGQVTQTDVYGEFEGRALMQEFWADEDGNYDENHTAYYLLDMETGEREYIDELLNGHVLALTNNMGHAPTWVLPDGTFLHMRNVEDGTCDIYAYNFNTGEERFLFNDDPNITFRIYGAYNGGHFGKHCDHQSDMTFYWISKEDFYAGNLEAMIQYDL